MNIEGAVVLVTGASSGIGEATARAVSEAGARVVLVARRESRIQQLASEMRHAIAISCDVTDPARVAQAVQRAHAEFGRIDVLVNNAGQGLQARIEEIELDDYRALLDLNLVAPLAMIKAVIPVMRKQGAGSIVNVSSGATFAAQAGAGAYTSSKAALNMLSDVARIELADTGIVVSTMYPFITATEFYGAVKAGTDVSKAVELGASSMAHPPALVAGKILELIRTGAARGDLVPTKFGGSYQELAQGFSASPLAVDAMVKNRSRLAGC